MKNSADDLCGLFNFRPKCLQTLRNPKCFVFIFFLVGMFKDCSGAYFIMMRNTVGDKYQMSSFQFQMISAVSNLGAIPVFLMHPFIDFFPRKSLWICVGVLLSASGHLITALPGLVSVNTDPDTAYNVMLLGYFLYGLGSTTVTFLSLAYIDDNVQQSRAPSYVGVALTATVIAQIVGAGMGALFSSASAMEKTVLSDPWWMGLLISSVGQIFLAPLVAMFPPKMIQEEDEKEDSSKLEFMSILKEYGAELGRVFTTRIFLYALSSYVLVLAAVQGFRTNMMVFVKHAYHKDEADITPYFGATILCTAVTTAGFGWFIKRFHFQLKYLTLWNITVLLCAIGCVLGLYSTGCENQLFSRDTLKGDSSMLGCSSCSEPRALWIEKAVIVCSEDGVHMFRSPCEAGCAPHTNLSSCACAELMAGSPKVTLGKCPPSEDCDRHFHYFVFVLIFFPCLLSTGPFGVSRYLTIMRSVEPRDKEVAIMLAQVLGQLLALIPSPPLFGLLLDRSCIHHKYGQVETECDLYDKDRMRTDFYFALICLIGLVLILEILIFPLSKTLKLYEEGDKTKDLKS